MPQPRFKGRFRKAGKANRRKKCSDRLHNINSLKHTPLADTDESQLAEEQQTVTGSMTNTVKASVTHTMGSQPRKSCNGMKEGELLN